MYYILPDSTTLLPRELTYSMNLRENYYFTTNNIRDSFNKVISYVLSFYLS